MAPARTLLIPASSLTRSPFPDSTRCMPEGHQPAQLPGTGATVRVEAVAGEPARRGPAVAALGEAGRGSTTAPTPNASEGPAEFSNLAGTANAASGTAPLTGNARTSAANGKGGAHTPAPVASRSPTEASPAPVRPSTGAAS